MTIIDRRNGIDGRESVVRTWPADAIKRVNSSSNNNWDAFVSVTPKYEDPYPLSDKYFLVSRMTGKGEQIGIYLRIRLVMKLCSMLKGRAVTILYLSDQECVRWSCHLDGILKVRWERFM